MLTASISRPQFSRQRMLQRRIRPAHSQPCRKFEPKRCTVAVIHNRIHEPHTMDRRNRSSLAVSRRESLRLISHSGRAKASVLRRSPRRDHQYRTPLPDGDDLLDRLAVLLPWDFHDQSVGPFPSLEVGTADHPVALAAAQPSERMRLTSNNSRLRVQSLYLYATHHRMRTGRPLGQATYHARGRSPNYKRNHRICFGLEFLGQH